MKKFLTAALVFLIMLSPLGVTGAFAAFYDSDGGNITDNSTTADEDGIQFTDDDSVSVTGGVNIGATGGVSAKTDTTNTGTLIFSGTHSVSGSIGVDSAKVLKLVRVNGAAGTVTFNGDVAATTFNFGADGTAALATGTDITGAMTANEIGTITAAGTSILTGQIGTNNTTRLKILNGGANAATVTLSTNAFIKTVNVTGDGTVLLNGGDLDTGAAGSVVLADTAAGNATLRLADSSDVTSAITSAKAGTVAADAEGILTAAGTSVVTGLVGTTTNRLKTINGGADAKTLTFSTNVFAATTNVTGDGTLLMNGGDLTGTSLILADTTAGNATVRLATGSDVTAAITTVANNEGILTAVGSSVVTGQVGTSLLKLKTINGGANASTAQFTSDVFATTTNVTGTGTIDLDGNLTSAVAYAANGTVTLATGKNITGAVSSGGANQGILTFEGIHTTGGAIGATGAANRLSAVNVNGGNVTMSNNIFATTTTVNTGGTLSPDAARTIEGNLTLAGTGVLSLGGNRLTMAGPSVVTTGVDTQINLSFNSGTSFGNILATGGNASIHSGTALNISVGGFVPNGTYMIIDGQAAGASVADLTSIIDNSNSLKFTQVVADNDNLMLTVSREVEAVTTNENNAAVAESLSMADASNGDLVTVLNTIDTLGSSEAVDSAYSQLDPSIDAGVTNASLEAGNGAMNALTTHLGEVRGVSAGETGLATGDSWHDAAIWAKGFGSFATQDERSGIAGYDSWTGGTALGFDGLITDQLRLGIGGGYAASNVDSDDANNANSDIDSYQGTVYASYNAAPWYVDAAFSFAWNDYDSTRDIVFIGRQATSDYSGQQYTTYAETGYVFKESGWEITPLASIQWTHLDIDSYTEEGAGSLNLHVDSQEYDVLQSGLGMSLAWPIHYENGNVFTPEVHGKWLYDFIGDEVQTTSTFTGGGAAFNTTGFDPAQSSFDVGVELKLATKGNWTLVADYDFEIKEDYNSHNGVITARYAY